MPVELVNLTPHDVIVFTDRGPITFVASGVFDRWDEVRAPGEVLRTDRGVLPVELVEYREVIALPEPRAGLAFLVSRVLAVGVERSDLYFPAGEVRDEEGRIIGCQSLGRFHHGASS